MNTKKLTIALAFIFCLLNVQTHGQNVITGKVVGVANSDTITVLQGRRQHTIRLYGIDTPERRQAYYYGNTNSGVFHSPGCKAYSCKNCTQIIKDRRDALAAGYRLCKYCNS